MIEVHDARQRWHIVAAIGVPNFIEMQYRAQGQRCRRTSSIHLAATAYRAANGVVVRRCCRVECNTG